MSVVCVCVFVINWTLLIAGTTPPRHHATILDGRGGEGIVYLFTGVDKAVLASLLFLLLLLLLLLSAPVSFCPPNFTPVKLEHVEQLELGYMPLRDDFERVQTSSYSHNPIPNPPPPPLLSGV